MIESNLTPVELLKSDISTGNFAPNVSDALRIRYPSQWQMVKKAFLGLSQNKLTYAQH